MNYLFKYKNKNNSKTKSLEFDINLDHSIKKINCEICVIDNNTVREIFKTTKYGKKYNIIKIIYEKLDKATYIIKSNKTHSKYILKIRHNSYNNQFEHDICLILKQNRHKNIIKYVDYQIIGEYYFFVYEYFDGMHLHDYLRKNPILDEYDIRNICKQIADGVAYLHSHNIIHCDLKLDNIIINDNNDIKIIDFDLSIICNKEDGYISDNIFGTMQYIAPESYDLCIYSKKTDIWQFGIILYILITNQFPYQNELTLINSYSNLCRQNLFKHIDFSIPKQIIFDKGYDILLYELLEKMLSFTDSNRYTVAEINNSCWMTMD
jgi:serine/threonine protein kinase